MARRLKGGGSSLFTPEEYFGLRSTWRAPEEFPTLRGAKRICVDVEAKDPQINDLGPGIRRDDTFACGFSVAIEDGPKWYFPVRHEGGDNLDPELCWRWLASEAKDYEGDVVGAHLIYDLDWMAEEGVEWKKVRRFHDVQNAEPLIDENRFSFRLDDILRDYGLPRKDEEMLRKAAAAYGFGTTASDVKSNLWRLPGRYAGAYGEGDADRPLKLLPLQLARLEAEGLLPIFDVESRLIPMLLAMRRRGVPVDLRRAEEVLGILRREEAKWLAEVRRWAGPRAELMAADSLAPAIEEKLGLRLPLTDKEKKPSITGAFLERHQDDPLCIAIACGRRVKTLAGTFVEGAILGQHVRGRIHCEFNQLKADREDGKKKGTIARFSSSNPNLQNVPSREKWTDEHLEFGGVDVMSLVRDIFVPEPGGRWGRQDLSQIEYRYLCHFAVGRGADEARRMYIDDPKTDFHKMAATMAKVDPNDAKKRKRVKNVNFGKVYGAQAFTLSVTMGCSLEEAKEFIAMYDERLPFVKATLNKGSEWAERRHFVTTILGRRGRFHLFEPKGWNDKRPPLPYEKACAAYGEDGIRVYKAYAALSKKLQGSAADHMKKGMVDIWDAGICADDLLGAPFLTVHDELDWNLPGSSACREAFDEATRLFAGAIELKVPVIAEASDGKAWGEAS